MAELPIKVRKLAAAPWAKLRRRNSRSSSMGLAQRSSHRMKAASRMAKPAAAASMGGEVQPARWALEMPSSRASSAVEERTAPSQSKRSGRTRRLSSWPAITSRVKAALTSTRGTVAKKTARQPKASTRKPPVAGPATAPAPTIVIIMPMALPRSVGGKAAMTMAMPVPCVMAAPAPCTMRARMSRPRSAARPAHREPMISVSDPMRYTRLAPMRSARRPMGSSRAMTVIAKPMTSHWTPGMSVRK